MCSRLAYTLSFWPLGAVVLSVCWSCGSTAWNLRQGFSATGATRPWCDADHCVFGVAASAAQLDGLLTEWAALRGVRPALPR